jgi:hypothetical protein
LSGTTVIVLRQSSLETNPDPAPRPTIPNVLQFVYMNDWLDHWLSNWSNYNGWTLTDDGTVQLIVHRSLHLLAEIISS